MKKSLFLLTLLVGTSLTVLAQRSPTHPKDIGDASFDDFVSYFDDWEPGTQPLNVSRMDDEFYIARQRPLARITDGDYQVNPDLDPERQMCLWVPLDDPTASWKALPRYCFEGDNFSLWSYVDIHGNWTAPWIRSTAGISDVAAKNGVKVGCVMSVPFLQNVTLNGTNTYSQILAKLTEQDANGNFVNSEKLVRLMKYYGINGLGFNSEFSSNSNTMTRLQKFFTECHEKGKEIGWDFQIHWYDGTNDVGGVTFDRGLTAANDANFKMSDMFFFNYNWYATQLANSQKYAESLGLSSYNIFAGFDIQGRSLTNSNWQALVDNKISIGFWGAHSQSLIHQSATDNGTSDVAIQKAYLTKQELIFSGGNHNPALTPDIKTDCTLANSSLLGFHGLARFLTAKSTIQQVPFVTRFNLGNGLKFRDKGTVTFDHKWHNLNTQDFMPTWRWWITDSNDQVTEAGLDKFITAELTWDDAYFGGSCLRLAGATDFSRVKLFKTMLEVEPTYNISLVYKMANSLATHAKLFVALKDNVTTYKEIDIPAANNYGEWTTFTATLDQLGIQSGDKIAMIGIVVDNTEADYAMYVGELAVRNPSQTFAPVAPTVKEVEILRGYDNTVDFKMRYASVEETGGVKTYNDEVDTWYYEIFFQQKDHEAQYLTATTSWAAYVIDAPMVSGYDGRQGRFGVRAVAPDGKQKSEISWSDYLDIPYDSPSSDVKTDRQVIKPNETFTVSLDDEMATAAQAWSLTNSLTGETLYESSDAKSFSTAIAETGAYDLHITDSEGNSTTYRGYIHVTPEETGAVPDIYTLTADKTAAEVGENVTFSYTSRDGEGTVSRGVAIADPNMLMIPGDVQQGKNFSYALWVKVDNYAHDKQGTNLINKNTIADSWPHNNWGDLWVTIRPEWTGEATHPANEVSFNTFGWEAHDNPNETMMSTGYSLNPGVWNHIVVTQQNNLQKLYFNGKRVAIGTFASSSRRENSSDSRIDKTAVANIFIGGGNVYKAGFNGWVDDIQIWNKALSDAEVLEAMKGYDDASVPDGLQAYYTFEDYNAADSTFANHGKLGSSYPARMVSTEDSGGENTTTASYARKAADNTMPGYPGLTGTLPITTTHTWNIANARISSDADKTATVSYAQPGEYTASLSLSNEWGDDVMALDGVITVGGGTDAIGHIGAETALTVYPNPFAERVNLRFAEDGNYVIDIYSTSGKRLQSNALEAQAGGVASVAVTGAKGHYIVKVTKDGKDYGSLRLIKK